MATRKFRVVVIESERGWGQKVDETRDFDTYEAAADFRDSINNKNPPRDAHGRAPDWYRQAGDPVEIK